MELKNVSSILVIVLLLKGIFSSHLTKELVLATHDGELERQSSCEEPVTLTIPMMNVEPAHGIIPVADQNFSSMNIYGLRLHLESKGRIELNEGELEKLFNGLKDDLSEVTKFYSYFKVLMYIDKSIRLIREFKETPEISVKINSMIRQKKIDSITEALKSANELHKQVKDIFCEKKCMPSQLKNQNMWNELCCFELRLDYVKKKFDRHNINNYPANDYERHNENKCSELMKLQGQLNKVRKDIYPMEEEYIKKHYELFKNELLDVIKEIYQNLKQCHEKEKTNFKWYFDILEGILEDINKIKNELTVYNEILKVDEKDLE